MSGQDYIGYPGSLHFEDFPLSEIGSLLTSLPQGHYLTAGFKESTSLGEAAHVHVRQVPEPLQPDQSTPQQ